MKTKLHKSTLRRQVARVAMLLAGLLAVVTGRSQPYSIDWHKISGGGAASANGQFALNGTIGQPDAGRAMAGGNYSLTGGFWAIYAVQNPGAPTLYIVKSGANAILYWPTTGSAGYLLESNGSVNAPGGWATVTPGPVSMGGFNYVTNQIVPGRTFYRLRHP